MFQDLSVKQAKILKAVVFLLVVQTACAGSQPTTGHQQPLDLSLNLAKRLNLIACNESCFTG